MVNKLYPVLDGIDPSWADIIVNANPGGSSLIKIEDISAIDSGTTVEVGLVKGASGGRVRRRTTGEKSDEFSWTLYRVGLRNLKRELMKVAIERGLTRGNQVIVGLVHFDIQVQHTPPGSDDIFEYRVKGARITGNQFKHAEGVDADQVEVPMSVIEIVEVIDGKEIVLL
jgi:hypothetical protein